MKATELKAKIEAQNPEITVKIENYGEYYRLNSFKNGEPWFRFYSFEPDFAEQIEKIFKVTI